jgi:hypothetical protein
VWIHAIEYRVLFGVFICRLVSLREDLQGKINQGLAVHQAAFLKEVFYE